jgi:hypothetical protein
MQSNHQESQKLGYLQMFFQNIAHQFNKDAHVRNPRDQLIGSLIL